MKTTRICVLLVLLLSLASSLQAAPIKIYVGASLGEAFETAAGLDGAFDVDIDADSETWKAFAGVSLGRVFGVEAAWHDFGTVECCPDLADAGFRFDAEGLSVAVVAGVPVWRARLFAKLGVISWEVDGFTTTLLGNFDFDEGSEDLMAGVGFDVKLTDSLSARAEWEVFEIEGDTVSLASVGIQLKLF